MLRQLSNSDTTASSNDENQAMNTANISGRLQNPAVAESGSHQASLSQQPHEQANLEGLLLMRDVRCEGMTLQPVTLDKAVAPLLPRPTAPFDRTERKRAHTSAVYYSECFLRGIEPLVADTAAVEIQGQYDKWWIQRTASKAETNEHKKTAQKRHRKEMDDSKHGSTTKRKYVRSSVGSLSAVASSSDQASISSGPNVVSVTSSQMDSSQIVATQSRDGIPPMAHISTLSQTSKTSIEFVKNRLIEDLRQSGGQIDTPEALQCMEILQTYYARCGIQKVDPSAFQGNWLTISKPEYTECKGTGATGESLYALGRIGFDMFKPTGLLCSVQASFNNVQPIDPKNPGRPLHVPKKLLRDIRKGECRLHSYDIVVAITVESGQDRKGNQQHESASDEDTYIVPRPIRGILTTQGYSISDPIKLDRVSIWFSGGTLEVQDEDDLEEWKRIFDVSSVPDRAPTEYASILAAKVLLGASLPENLEDDGTMSFSLKRPIGGHGSVYCDVVFMDDQLRIMKGHHGSVYICIRVPEIPS